MTGCIAKCKDCGVEKEVHNFVDGVCTVCGMADLLDKFVKIQAYLDEQIALENTVRNNLPL